MSSSANPISVDNSDEDETPIEQAVANTLGDEFFHDVELEGSDGVRVPANRTILAMRSKYFRKMLIGRFNEASSKVVPIGTESSLLKLIVEYVCTGKADILVETDVGSSQDPLNDDQMSDYLVKFQTILSLSEAATYFTLPGLLRATHKCLSTHLEAIPSLSFAAMEACSQQGASIPHDIEELAWSKIRRDEDVLRYANAATLSILSPATLERISQDDEAKRLKPSLLVQIICRWASFAGSSELQSGEDRERQSFAKALVAKHVPLERIDPEILSSVVAPSRLVAIEELLEAYKFQALKAKKPSSELTWKESKRPIIAVGKNHTTWTYATLECFPAIMSSGIHQWTVEIERDGYCRLGVAASEAQLSDDAALGEISGTWGFKRFGHSLYVLEGREVLTELSENEAFDIGDCVTMTLNLLPDTEENGTLSISVDGKPAVQGFTNLRAYITEHGGGFVPAVSISPNCNGVNVVRIISFDKR